MYTLFGENKKNATISVFPKSPYNFISRGNFNSCSYFLSFQMTNESKTLKIINVKVILQLRNNEFISLNINNDVM